MFIKKLLRTLSLTNCVNVKKRVKYTNYIIYYMKISLLRFWKKDRDLWSDIDILNKKPSMLNSHKSTTKVSEWTISYRFNMNLLLCLRQIIHISRWHLLRQCCPWFGHMLLVSWRDTFICLCYWFSDRSCL